MKIREKTKEALLNVLARLIQIVVAMLIIGPFVSGVFNPRVFLVGFLLFFGFSGLLTLIGQSMKEA